MSALSDVDFYTLININEVKPLSPNIVAEDYEKSNREWYHLILNEDDFSLMISLPDLKWYSLCRCHLVADDKSTAHEHIHALIHFTNGKTAMALRKRLQRLGKKLHSKTTFKKILCLDHAVGVLRYISCKDGQKPLRRDFDGLRGTPHAHYCRQVFDKDWLHGRGKRCVTIRDEISLFASKGVSDILKYTSHQELHDKSTCGCDRGDVGIRKRQLANEKRREFYKTEKGISIKKMYKEKKEEKQKLIKQLLELGLNKKAELQRETIVKLISLL